ncbi:hypothetical protein STENM327S_05363 [Streptomyces tendae]
MVLRVTRWIRRYAGGRLSCLASWYAGERGSPMRAAWLRIQPRVKVNASALAGSMIGRR